MSTQGSRSKAKAQDCARSGIRGLDSILRGGFVRNRMYLIEGVPGSGKTTLALQLLQEGVRQGETVLYITLSETVAELQQIAASHGWSLEGITFRELVPSEESLQPDEQYTMFHPAEVELSETIKKMMADIEQIRPARVVLDSLSELRLLASSPLRYRRQILALKHFFSGRKSTVLLLDDMTSAHHDLQVHSIAHGVIQLEQMNPEFGAERRRLQISKYRGVGFRGGYHDYSIRHGGLEVFPRLVSSEHRSSTMPENQSSGIVELDELLGGGIERGSSTLIVGASGTGKSSLAMQFAVAAAEQGQNAAMFVFDESLQTLLTRAGGLGIPLQRHVDAGRITIQQINPAELSPGEFAHTICMAVEERNATVVVIDSLNGYLLSMPEERYLILQLHELLYYLGQSGVATIVISVHQGMIGSNMSASVDATYLADTVILMRYFELDGEIRQAISVMKKRGGSHEKAIREFSMSKGRIHIGAALRGFRGVLTGVPFIEQKPLGQQPSGSDT